MKWLICCVVIAGLVSGGTVSAQEFLNVHGVVTITDPGSMLEVSGIAVGSGGYYDYGNRLYVSNGGYVRCLGSTYVNGTVSTGVDYGWLYSFASITGNGSLLDIGGDLQLWSSSLGGRTPGTWDPWGVPCYMEISAGAEVSVVGDISIINRSTLRLGSGGKLTVGSDFNASMNGFIWYSGSTLAVEGQFSGLSVLGAGKRLETPNVLGDMTVHGTLAPGNSPADSIVEGGLTIASDGTLEMELGGYDVGTEYDRLTVAGLSTLDGTLDLVFLDGFMAAYGDSFDLFNWDGGVSGEFASIGSSALSDGLSWDTSELYTTGTLSVIPEPGTMSMMGLSSGILLFTRNLRCCKKAGLSLMPIRGKYDDGLTFDHPVPEATDVACWTTIDLAGLNAPRISALTQHIGSWKKSSSNRF
ncbi:MAG: hypothetical protein K9M54_04475 [Kiritimatiellales bacterium]|nr:hypothetical protein [Kiritimatiellales bacterium]